MTKSAFVFLLTVFSVTGCVSVSLSPQASKKAEGVSFSAPAKPFQAEDRGEIDQSWRNTKNSNSISYFSDCGDSSDPNLETIANGVLSGLTNLKLERNETLNFRDREAKRILAVGKVDGVPTYTDLLIFKRNRCIYVLTYVALEKNYAVNSGDFEKFIGGFNPP